MSATYAGAKGKSSPLPASPLSGGGAKAPRPLSAAAQARVAENKGLVEAHLPDMLPFFKDLYAEGLIDGWRAVESVRLIEGVDHGAG